MMPLQLSVDALQEPWRLWTCHLAHHDWQHAADNLLALAIPFALAPRRERVRLLGWLFLAAPFLSLALLPFLEGGSYCGLSGLACFVWAVVGLHLASESESFAVGGLMLGLLALKFCVESFTGCGLIQHDGRWQTLSESHSFGTLLGLLVCSTRMAFARTERRVALFLRRQTRTLLTASH